MTTEKDTDTEEIFIVNRSSRLVHLALPSDIRGETQMVSGLAMGRAPDGTLIPCVTEHAMPPAGPPATQWGIVLAPGMNGPIDPEKARRAGIGGPPGVCPLVGDLERVDPRSLPTFAATGIARITASRQALHAWKAMDSRPAIQEAIAARLEGPRTVNEKKTETTLGEMEKGR